MAVPDPMAAPISATVIILLVGAMRELQGVTVTLNCTVIAPSFMSSMGSAAQQRRCHCVHHPCIPPPGLQPLGAVQEIPGATTPGDEGTNPIWVWLTTCKAPALFVENPFRKPWERDNRFAVGWRGEAGALTSVRVLAGFPCMLAGFMCCRL